MFNKPNVTNARIHSDGYYYLIGSSRMARVNPIVIERITGKETHNIKIDGATLSENRLLASKVKEQGNFFIYSFDVFSSNKSREKYSEINTRFNTYLKELESSTLFDKYFNSVSTTINSDHTTSLDKEFMNNVLNYINENINDEKLNVENLAGELLLSRSKLYRKIKALTGDTANEFIRKVRLEKAKHIIETTEYTISEVCYKVGFSSPSYFTKCFKDYFEFLPTEVRDSVK